ncbi:hypothetical protein SNE25_21350 [Mucilaginibacter sabulilitoris]|uniref:Uncharacterized protein n=1 Tax=Mucilaginibacter sabulilitoris TaxID=1173583 RepID=A0ABZ0TH07_9SPHI|nr:hypothetical protein [Mucilaginibacter sabulilitoris]WPU91866.1 hypothetical protein SNE25_21350 [Mucilaginibacter sabulilitoris]
MDGLEEFVLISGFPSGQFFILKLIDMHITNLKCFRQDNKPFFGLSRLATVLCLLLLFAASPMMNQARAQANDTTKLTKAQQEKLAKEEKDKKDKAAQAALTRTANEAKAQLDAAISKGVQAKVDSILKAVSPCANGQCTITIVAVIVIALVSLGVSAFLILSAINGPKDNQFALGLPDGSIRAIIALLVIVFYILVSVTLSMFSPSASPIATDLTKTLGTLVVAVSAFYFGSKTAEQSAKTATENVTKAVNSATNNNTDPTVVPKAIINAAIETNKTAWLALYHANDIIAGKKQSAGVVNNLDCIVFIVADKVDVPGGAKVIPPFIVYNDQGKTYNIPTDVRT